MRLTFRAFWLTAALVVCAAAQPVIGTNGIVNGASFVYAGLPNGNIAQGSIFSIFGTNLGPAAPVNANAFPLPTDNGLGGVTVQVASSGGTVNAILLMASSGQINAILPSTVPAGTANVTVTFNGAASAPQQITVVKSSFGSFAVNQGGSGPAALFNFNSDASQPQNAIDQAAKPGQVVILWGTGLGPILPAGFNEALQPQQIDMKDQLDITISVGGIAIKPQYAGRSQYAGEDQINFQLPDNIATACYVPVTIKINGVVSNTTSLSIAPSGGTCSDDFTSVPSGLSQGLRTGSIALVSTTPTAAGQTFAFDGASAVFTKVAAADVGKSRGTYGVSSYGACNVFTYKNNPSFTDNTQITYLDAGTPLTLTLPDNTTKLLTQSPLVPGVYTTQAAVGTVPAPFLVKGTYKIAVPGGSGANAVGPFNATLNVPDPLAWTNMGTLPSPIPRTSGLPITWSGGDPNDAVLITGNSTADDKTGAGFYCLAKNQDKQFTIPADVLSVLPASSSGEGAGTLAVGDVPTSEKFLIKPPPSGLDLASFLYEFFSATTVSYQ